MELTYNPFLPEVRANPYPLYQRLRDTDPVHFNERAGIWFLTRHEDCRTALRDSRFSATLGQDMRRRRERLPRSMLNSDPPDHTRLRSPVSKAFTAQTVERLRVGLQSTVERILDSITGRGEMDVISDLASPLAVRMLGELFRIPPADLDQFREWACAVSVHLDPLAEPKDQDRALQATTALDSYLSALAAERRRSPEDDFLSALLRIADEPGGLTAEESLTVCNLFIIGGYEPMTNLIGNGLLALLQHPEEFRRLHENPSLVKTAVEELLRFDSPIQIAARVATEDVEIGPKTISKGQAVVTLFGAANRDPAVFHHPDRLDVGRSRNPHLGFGAGAHFCLGAPLARLAGQVALGTLVGRYQRLTLATERPEWRDSLVPHGLTSLPVALGAV